MSKVKLPRIRMGDAEKWLGPLHDSPEEKEKQERVLKSLFGVHGNDYVGAALNARDILMNGRIALEDRLTIMLRPEMIPGVVLHSMLCDIAEQVAPIYEVIFPDATRPREAIRIKRQWILGESSAEELAKVEGEVWSLAHDAPMTLEATFKYAARHAIRAIACSLCNDLSHRVAQSTAEKAALAEATKAEAQFGLWDYGWHTARLRQAQRIKEVLEEKTNYTCIW